LWEQWGDGKTLEALSSPQVGDPSVPQAKPNTFLFERFSDLLDRLGHIPPDRIFLRPAPGTAREEDVLQAEAQGKHLCELIDGTLVEKAMGFYESRLASVLIGLLEAYLADNDVGIVLAPDGMTRVEPGQVRMPDVSFYSWTHFPDHILPAGQILNVIPDLAVEILSPGNTKQEMKRKRKEYFFGGASLVWEIDPVKKTIRIYTAPDRSQLVREKGKVEGAPVLPGFTLSVEQLFQRAGVRAEQ
jgi:Uma2 family endonuclease